MPAPALAGEERPPPQSFSLSVSDLFAFADRARDAGDYATAETAYRALAGTTALIETGLAWRRDNGSPVLHAFLELLEKTTSC